MENSSPQIDPARLPELYEAICQLNASAGLDEIVEQTLKAAIKLTGAERAFIKLRDPYSLYTMPELNREMERLVSEPVKILFNDIAQKSQRLLVTDTHNDPRFATGPLSTLFASHTLLVVPVKTSNEFLGVIIVDRTTSAGVFTTDDLTTLVFFAGWAALAIYGNGSYSQSILSSITNDFSTPIAMILGYTELMLVGKLGPLPYEQKQAISVLYRSAYKMRRWLNDYLEIAQIEYGSFKLEITDFDLQACISEITAEQPLTDLEQVLAEFEPTLETSSAGIPQRIRAKQQLLSVNISDFPLLRADRNRVLSVIKSLLSDAIHYTAIGGRIELTAEIQGTSMKLAIHSQKQNWFSAHLVERIITMMGGAIGFESEPGKGSTFWFTLPIATKDMSTSP